MTKQTSQHLKSKSQKTQLKNMRKAYVKYTPEELQVLADELRKQIDARSRIIHAM